MPECAWEERRKSSTSKVHANNAVRAVSALAVPHDGKHALIGSRADAGAWLMPLDSSSDSAGTKLEHALLQSRGTTAACFSPSGDAIVASRDAVLRFGAASTNAVQVIACSPFGSPVDFVLTTPASVINERVAIGAGSSLHIAAQKQQPNVSHTLYIATSVLFSAACFVDENCIATVSDDRCLRMWELDADEVGRLLFSSGSLCGGGVMLTAVACPDPCDTAHSRFLLAVGASDGSLRLFDASHGLRSLMLTATLQLSAHISALSFMQPLQPLFTEENTAAIFNVQLPSLVCATSSSVCKVNPQTLSVEHVFSHDLGVGSLHALSWQKDTSAPIFAVCSSAFDAMLLPISVPPDEPGAVQAIVPTQSPGEIDQEQCENKGPFSVFPSKPLPPKSPLLAELHSSVNTASSKRTSIRRGKSHEKAVTFHANIKSSGYGQPHQRSSRSFHRHKSNMLSGASSRNTTESFIPTNGRYMRQCTTQSNAALCVAFSPNGTHIASGGVDRVARSAKVENSTSETAFVDHDAPIVGIQWSHSGNLFLTASTDRSAKLWASSKTTPKLSFTCSDFTSDVRAARFLHLDRFVLVSNGSTLSLFRYALGSTATVGTASAKGGGAAGKHSVEQPRSRRVSTVRSSSKEILDVDCCNSFISHLCVTCGSNRAVETFDLSVEKRVRVVENAHTRPPGCVRMFGSSKINPQPAEASEMFATVAPDTHAGELIKLWDMRQAMQEVKTLYGHATAGTPSTSRQLAASPTCAFSPDMRYLVCGTLSSGSRSAAIYDLRKDTVITRLEGHRDNVIAVDWHPTKPIVATASVDGEVRLFANR